MRTLTCLCLCSILIAEIAAAENLFALYGRLLEAWKEKNYVQVMTLAEDLISRAPGNSGAQFQYARALAANGRPQESLQALQLVAQMGGAPRIQEDEAFASIRTRPEFEAVRKRFQENRLPAGRSDVVLSRIVRLYLENPNHVGRLEVLQVNHPLFALPTTGDLVSDEFHYIANSQLRSFDEEGRIFPTEKLNDTVILKVDLLESEKEELREVHEKEIEAHLRADVQLLLEDAPEEFLTVSSGKIQRVTREQERKMFAEYFRDAVYLEYQDLEPPAISVSEDGRSGWVITRTRVRRTQAGTKQEFVYAGIMTYAKRGDKWIRTANVSTFE